MSIVLDSDGVFADFDLHVYQLFGKWPREMNEAHMWALINKRNDFWYEMPLKSDAMHLWEKVVHLQPMVLTGCPKSGFEVAAAAKKEWWKRHFDHELVVTCLSRDKALHIRRPGEILVDDMPKNIRRWEAAGGIGIRHKNADDTLEQLKRYEVI